MHIVRVTGQLIPPYFNPYSKEDGEFIGLGYGYKLYNLKKDISQQENLADKYPKKLGEMINRFEYLKSTTNKVTRYLTYNIFSKNETVSK